MAHLTRVSVLLVALFLFTAIRSLPASDWPQWRGPFLNGSTDETGLPASWDQRSIRWVTDLPGEAGSTPVVFGDRIFLTSTDRKTRALLAFCINRADGAVLWNKTVPGLTRRSLDNRDASPSAVTDGRSVYFLFGNGEFLATDFAGQTIWQRNLERDFGPLTISFLYSASPLLYRDRLYIPMIRDEVTSESDFYPPHPTKLESFLLCVDPATGRDIWKQSRPSDEYTVESRESYATLMPRETAPGQAEIVAIGADFLTGNDWRDGRELWRVRYEKTGGFRQRVVPTPLIANGLIVASKPRKGPLLAVRPEGAGNLTTGSVVWEFTENVTPDVPSVLSYGGRFYCIQDSKKTLTCLDPATGRKIWTGELGGGAIFHASPLGADGKIYCMNLSGEIIVAKAGDQFKILGRMNLGGAPAMSSLLAAHGALFIRTSEKLYSIQERGNAK